jgi:FkbM family methyltransferase
MSVEVYRLKSFLFIFLRKAYRWLGGTGVHKIPGVFIVKGFLFELLRPNRSTVVEIQGSKMYVDPEGLPRGFRNTFQAYIIRNGWEELTTKMFKESVRKGNVVLDLGANVGYYSLLAAQLVGKEGKVYSFEPEPNNFSVLLKNIELNSYDNIVPVQKAVSDTSGKITLFLHNRDTGAHTIYQPEPGEHHFAESVEVETVVLDEFLDGKEKHVDIVKVDVEGAEMAVLSGMKEMITKNKDLKMFIEFHPPGIKRRGDSSSEFARRLLEDYGFSVLAIGDYKKGKKYLKITSAEELINFCKGGKTVNLFVEKAGSNN